MIVHKSHSQSHDPSDKQKEICSDTSGKLCLHAYPPCASIPRATGSVAVPELPGYVEELLQALQKGGVPTKTLSHMARALEMWYAGEEWTEKREQQTHNS